MPVEMRLKITEGWKANENKRFGEALVIEFYNPVGDKTLFEYAPKLDDKDFWGRAFDTLIKYDEHLVALLDIHKKIEEIKTNEPEAC